MSTDLLRRVLEEAQADGYGLATLYASTLPVYRKVGFEVAGQRILYTADARDLHVGRTPGRLIPVEDPAKARPVLERLHAEEMKATAGGLDRHDLNWARKLDPGGDRPVAVYLIEGREGPEGYVAARHAPDDRLEVLDWTATTPATVRSLLAYLAGYRSVVRTVSWYGGPSDSLVFHMPDKGWRVGKAQHWLTRIVDVERALGDRGYPAGLAGSVTLEVTDALLPQNEGRFVLTVRGRCRQGRTARPRHHGHRRDARHPGAGAALFRTLRRTLPPARRRAGGGPRLARRRQPDLSPARGRGWRTCIDMPPSRDLHSPPSRDLQSPHRRWGLSGEAGLGGGGRSPPDAAVSGSDFTRALRARPSAPLRGAPPHLTMGRMISDHLFLGLEELQLRPVLHRRVQVPGIAGHEHKLAVVVVGDRRAVGSRRSA